MDQQQQQPQPARGQGRGNRGDRRGRRGGGNHQNYNRQQQQQPNPPAAVVGVDLPPPPNLLDIQVAPGEFQGEAQRQQNHNNGYQNNRGGRGGHGPRQGRPFVRGGGGPPAHGHGEGLLGPPPNQFNNGGPGQGHGGGHPRGHRPDEFFHGGRGRGRGWNDGLNNYQQNDHVERGGGNFNRGQFRGHHVDMNRANINPNLHEPPPLPHNPNPAQLEQLNFQQHGGGRGHGHHGGVDGRGHGHHGRGDGRGHGHHGRGDGRGQGDHGGGDGRGHVHHGGDGRGQGQGRRNGRNRNNRPWNGGGENDGNQSDSASVRSEDSQRSRRSGHGNQSRGRKQRGGGTRGTGVDARHDEFFSKLIVDAPNAVIEYFGKEERQWESLIQSLPDINDQNLALLVHILGEKICSEEESPQASTQNALISPIFQPTFGSKIQQKCRKMGVVGKTDEKETESDNAENSVTKEKDWSEENRFLRNLYTFLYFSAERMLNSSINFIKPILPAALKAINLQLQLSSSENAEENDDPDLDPVIVSLKSDYEDFHEMIRELSGDIARKNRTEAEARDKEKAEADSNKNGVEKKAETETDSENRKRRPNHFFFTEKEEEILHARDPPDDFRQIPIIPSISEIMAPDDSFLRPNKTSGAYRDSDHYLDVQFRLLREDFLRPLKNGIQEFMKNKREYLSRRKRMPLGTVRLYQKIRIANVELVRDTVMYSLQLEDCDYKRVKWDKSRRLLNGSLLLFTSDNFKSAYFGVIARRDAEELTTKGTFGITWEGVFKPDISRKNEEFLMFESECFFEAYRHTLQVLKDIPLDTFPMAKFIVESSAAVGPPGYLLNTYDMMKIGETYFPPLEGPWPSAEELKLDPTQFDAFRAALTKEFAIVQGPPGTGKTFLGLKVVEALLSNPRHWWDPQNRDGGPILVVCLTNHALDQFLEGILTLLRKLEPDQDPGLIRVGGKNKSSVLEEFSLQRRRFAANKMHMHDRNYQFERSKAWRRVKQLEGERSDLMSEFLGLANPAGIVDFAALSVWRALRDDLPEFSERMWQDYLENPDWYSLSGTGFSRQNFNVDELIQQFFKVRPKPKVEAPAPQRPQPLDDDEDYDLDELQENRILDDVYYQAEFKDKGKGEQHHNKDLFYKMSIQSLNKIVQEKTQEITSTHQNQTQNQNTFYRREDDPDTRNKQEKKTFASNQSKFLKTFLNMVNDGLVDLPVIQYPVAHFHRNTAPEVAWAIYFQIVERARTLVGHSLAEMETDLVQAQKELQKIQRQGDGILLQNTKVVGMTTTAASKASDLLQAMKSKIVIVEEAAEVLEAHIINCITQYCQHLIMIGDHQQLRPNITVMELATKYHLNISLFERMVNNKLNCYKLLVQHRMRPSISDLVRGTIYNELEDHSSVLQFPNIRGMSKNLFFIKHKHQESSESDSVTKTNFHEAKFLVALCKYLIVQGYSSSEITILATYTGQMFLIKKELTALTICKGVRVTAVDNFQGEENTIILLSLVRSNQDNNVGFLKVDNRICVALSRAREGLYIIGNMDNLVASSPTWKSIQKKLIGRGEIGGSLPLLCQTHGIISHILDPKDFSKYPEGGCSLLCGQSLPCGHPCKAVCHPGGLDHQDTRCTRPCDKLCPNGHKCTGKCFMPCKPCGVKIEKPLIPCGHLVNIQCHQNVKNILCKVEVSKILRCGHEQMLSCHIAIDSVQCDVNVEKKLRCGHSTTMKCHMNPTSYKCQIEVTKRLNCGHDVQGVKCCDGMETYFCHQLVMKTLVPCGHSQQAKCYLPVKLIQCETLVQKSYPSCSHQITVPCHEKNNPMICRLPCNIRIKCGHQCRQICHPDQDPNHYSYRCEKQCAKTCKNGHQCQTRHICCEVCPPCVVEMDKHYTCQTHTIRTQCRTDVSRVRCEHPCVRKLVRCGHNCEGLCCDPCHPCQIPVKKLASCGHEQTVICSVESSADRCNVMVKAYSQAGCGHYSEVPCRLQSQISRSESTKYCTKPCGIRFEESDGGCGHFCKGTCSECLEGRLHKKCGEECGRTLVCGHVCGFPCAEVCPPCQQRCNMRCPHSICGGRCGEPCKDCCEPCTWRCEHKRCTKLCRDPCNREPCEEPCKQPLRCGHTCIGICGEPCPPLCRICNKDQLVEFILYGNEEDPDSRFVYLEDCRHCIEVEGMDYYMNNEIEEGAIVAKSCPRCKTLIRHSKRYGNILRRRLADVMKVKSKVFGDAKAIKRKQADLITELTLGESPTSPWSKYLPKFRKDLMDKLATVVVEGFLFLKKEKIVPKILDQHTWGSIELVSNHGKDALKVLAEAEVPLAAVGLGAGLQRDLLQRYVKIFELISNRKLPLSKMEMADFEREFERLFDMKQLYVRRSSPRFSYNQPVRVESLYKMAEGFVISSKVYTMDKKASLRSTLEEIDKCLMTGIGISEREKREVLSAMGMRQGHWYKCPNGHVYVIDRCGGAMEESKCNECGAKIGGGSHQLRRDNALATEMDGAQAPAWPTNLQYN